MHCKVSEQASVPNQTPYNDFKCFFGFAEWPLFKRNTLPWKSYTNKPQTHTSSLRAVTIQHLTDKDYINWETVLLLFLTKAQGFFCSLRLCTKQSSIPCLVRLQQKESSCWNCQAVSPGTRLGALKGSLCSARPSRASETPSEEFSHLLTKSEHTVLLKSRGVSKQ